MAEQPDPAADPPALARQLATEHARLPAVGPQQRGEDAQQRGLAGAVGAEHREGRAPVERQGDPVERRAVAVAADEAVEHDGRLAHVLTSGVSTVNPRRAPTTLPGRLTTSDAPASPATPRVSMSSGSLARMASGRRAAPGRSPRGWPRE